jgi:predicted DNA-binding transcriptional regulator YafY
VQSRMRMLMKFIENEKKCTFTYQDVVRRVAPSSLNLDKKGTMTLRAFQISPEQGWRTFYVRQIKNLQVEGDRL